MAWIKDHNPERSMRALAGRMLEDPELPVVDVTLVHLANMLSKADRGDSAWFFGAGAPWIPVLARTLDLPDHEVRELLQNSPGTPADKRSLFVFDEFPGLRPLDLDEEALPPGLPSPPRSSYIKQRQRAPTWWTVRPGTGADLVRRQVERDPGWTVVEAEDWDDVQAIMPAAGRVLLVLQSAEGAPAEAPVLDGEVEVLWVMCPWPAPAVPEGEDSRKGPQGWALAGPAAPNIWLPRLIGWVEERYLGRGGLELKPFDDALDEPESWLYALAGSFDEAFELLALCDRVGTDTLLGDASDDQDHEARMGKVLNGWLRLYAPRLEHDAPAVAALLKGQGRELLVHLEANRKLELHQAPLPWGVWQRLLPESATDDALGEEIARLARAGRLDEVKRLAERPRAPEVLQGLADLGLLVRGEGGWTPGRPLVQVVLRQLVPLHLRRSGWRGIGALLLDSQDSEETLDWLCDRAVGDSDAGRAADLCVVEELMRGAEAGDPRGASALDAACRALAVAVLSGVTVPVAMLQKAVDVVDSVALSPWLGDLPVPAIRIAERPRPDRGGGWHTSADPPFVEGLTGLGGWYLAGLVLGRALHQAGGELPLGPMWPWAGDVTDESAALTWRLHERVAMSLGAYPQAARHGVDEDEEGWVETLGLALWERLGLKSARHPLEHGLDGEILVRAMLGDEFDNERLEEALRLPLGLAALDRACARHEVDVAAVLAWCWPRWLGQGWNAPPLSWVSPHNSGEALAEHAERLWQGCPPDAVSAEHLNLVAQASYAHHLVPRAVWSRILDLLLEDPDGRAAMGLDDAWWGAIPADLVLKAIEQGRLGVQYSGPGGAVWAALPAETLAVVDRLAAQGPPLTGPGSSAQPGSHLLGLLFGAPDDRCAEVLTRIERWLDSPEAWPGRPSDNQILILLYRWVERRRPSWLDAWRLLGRVRQ